MWKIVQVLALLVYIAGCAGSPLNHPAPHAVVLNLTDQVVKYYDYIIVGGGTSGLVVANRLTENPHITVLVIERGYLLVFSLASFLNWRADFEIVMLRIMALQFQVWLCPTSTSIQIPASLNPVSITAPHLYTLAMWSVAGQ